MNRDSLGIRRPVPAANPQLIPVRISGVPPDCHCEERAARRGNPPFRRNLHDSSKRFLPHVRVSHDHAFTTTLPPAVILSEACAARAVEGPLSLPTAPVAVLAEATTPLASPTPSPIVIPRSAQRDVGICCSCCRTAVEDSLPHPHHQHHHSRQNQNPPAHPSNTFLVLGARQFLPHAPRRIRIP